MSKPIRSIPSMTAAGGAAPGSLETPEWTTQQWQRFLASLPAGLTSAQMGALDTAFHFTGSISKSC
jgi:hypothetical protein